MWEVQGRCRDMAASSEEREAEQRLDRVLAAFLPLPVRTRLIPLPIQEGDGARFSSSQRMGFWKEPIGVQHSIPKDNRNVPASGTWLGIWTVQRKPQPHDSLSPRSSFGSVSDSACKRQRRDYMKELDCTSTASVDPIVAGPHGPFIFIRAQIAFQFCKRVGVWGLCDFQDRMQSSEQRTHPVPLAKIHSLIFLQVHE